MKIREELILRVLAKENSVVELAEEYCVARKTICKWAQALPDAWPDWTRGRITAAPKLADEDVRRASARDRATQERAHAVGTKEDRDGDR